MTTAHRLASTMPMEAKLVATLPEESGWTYEPKWDGFRAIASRDGDAIEIMSKSGKSLARYFPEVVAMLASTRQRKFAIDGELILPVGDILSFDALQARLHPAESRIKRLSVETPALLMLFDCLSVADEDLLDRPFSERRRKLEQFHERNRNCALLLSANSADLATARNWLMHSGGALDGVVAKQAEAPYQPGERAMRKIKQHRTADCVVGGFRLGKNSPQVASLLLGLYDEAGLLNHVGFTSGLGNEDKAKLTKRLEALVTGPGFTGKAPCGPSRWNNGRESEWHPLKPELVVEVTYDRVTGDRFRHGTGLLRWRPDKRPEQCTMDQLQCELQPSQMTALLGTVPDSL